ncbi:hypothetical protein IVA96_20155 [Bradyrhizobium sp. 159]|uniref:hypothetical protein n=1 Tax=Bradyrhizobium sp. 159 TaxID=2782632 RepID=UPI001FF7B531|nr:hypothetical protein [Bradyrhizobium sp. 159]MCK1618906.1 hypothetical protein [Bradyrhizobium sp. 159]
MRTSTKSQNTADIKTFGSDEYEDRDSKAVLARSRLADARKLFERRFWKVLPRNERGMRILRWGADHAWLAGPTNPKRSVRRWCRKWAPWLTDGELSQIVAKTEVSNKRWSNDQCAAVLEVSLRISRHLRFRFIGANDDPNYEIRYALKREDAAKRSRKYRAARSTGGKRGRPALKLSEEEKLKRQRTQDAKRARRHRASRKNASRDISNIRTRDGLKRDVESRTNKDFNGRALARVGQQAKDPIGSISGVLSDDQSLARQPDGPDGPIPARAFWDEDPDVTLSRKPNKTRIRSTFRLTRRQREIAAEEGISRDCVQNLFDEFTLFHLSQRTYSTDWDVSWRNWLIHEIEIDEKLGAMNRAWRAA